ncbi:MAG: AAA family ATPase [Candidatus Micrarchaeia archaeon]
MVKICLSGLTGSGKTTLGTLLSKELNIRHITKDQARSYQEMLKELSATKSKVLRLGQVAVPKYAKDFDSEIAKEAEKYNCVVSTWLSPWVIKGATLRVLLYCSFDERARRKARQLHISISKAKEYVKAKDAYAERSFKKIYGIDIRDHSVFDLAINTEKLNHKEVVSIISMLSIMRDKRRFK